MNASRRRRAPKPGQRCTRPMHTKHPDRHEYDRAANTNWYSVYGYTAKRCGYVEPARVSKRERPFEATTAAVFPPPKGRVLADDLATALDEAHKICTGHIHCGTVFGAREHNQLERAVAAALVAAFYRGARR